MAKKDNSELYLFSDTTTTAGEALLTEHKEEQAFYSMPTSPASNLAMVVFTHGKEQLGELPSQEQEHLHFKGKRHRPPDHPAAEQRRSNHAGTIGHRQTKRH